MAEYYRTKVVEATITAGFSMAAWRSTLNGKGIETSWHNTWRNLLSVRKLAAHYRPRVGGT